MMSSSHTLPVRLTGAVPGLGQTGDVRTVKRGYARNFLLPRALAVPVSPRTAARALAQQAKRSVPSNERSAVIALAAELQGKHATITARANDDGRLFASVSAQAVATALGTDPIFKVEPVKQVGDHEVVLDFGHDITAAVTVTVTAEPASRKR